MRHRYDPRYYGVGDIAKICGCSHRTVSTWIDRGHLKGHRLPSLSGAAGLGGGPSGGPRGPGDRRVEGADLLAFLLRHGLPVPPELRPPALSVLSDDGVLLGLLRDRLNLEVRAHADAYHLGVTVGTGGPCAVLLDFACGHSVCSAIGRHLRQHRPDVAAYAVACYGDYDVPEGLFRATYHGRGFGDSLAADLDKLFGTQPASATKGGAT